jgi:hypothetical protein
VPVKDCVAKFRRTFPWRWNARGDYCLYDERRRELSPYYIGWSKGDDSGLDWIRRPVDRSGVLTTTSGGYRPIDILQFGLQCHADWVRNDDPTARQRFLAQADWAVHAQTDFTDIPGVYAFPGGWKRYACEPGFRSAMAQGLAISLLLRAYQASGAPLYRDRAVTASSSYFREVGEGGVTWRGPDGSVVFEGAAALPPSHILHAWIYAIWGLFELCLVLDDARTTALCRQSLATLRAYLPHYDGDAWSYYSLLAAPNGFRPYATLTYHAVHIAQLHVLASMTGDDCYSSTALRWQSLLDSRRSRRLVLANTLAGLAIASTTRGDTVPGGARSVV